MVVPVVPDWAGLVDLTSGRILLDDAPPIDVRGLDVLGQGVVEEGDADRLEQVAFSYFDSAPKRAGVPAPAGEQLPLPAPPAPVVERGGLRLVASAPEPEVEVEELPERVPLFGSAPDGEDEDEDDDDDR